MKIEKIKPIPKYIERIIKAKDKKIYPNPTGVTRYYAYLTKNDGELVKVTVAVRHYHKRWLCKQVSVHGVHSETCFVKDMAYFYIGGYVTGWYDKGITKYPKWYESTEWGWSEDKYFDPFAPIVNKEYISKYPEYKYSAYDLYDSYDILGYLRIYEKYPQAEYLLKLGLSKLVKSMQILEGVSKNKQFRHFLIKNAEVIRNNYYYINTIFQAFKKNRPLKEIQAYEEAKKTLVRDKDYKQIKELFNNDYTEYFNYVGKQNISNRLYLDYLKACNYLGIDMSIEKNRFPHDFKRWHDIRIDEYHSKKAEEDEKARKEFYDKFRSISNKYTLLQDTCKGIFICLIPKSPHDLLKEGDALHHCVGRMNYDQKFIREETLIFFIRSKDAPDIPLATIEYSLEKKKVLQCYGDNDTKPCAELEDYVYKKWLPYANRKLKKIAS